jgi:hypothetical protein
LEFVVRGLREFRVEGLGLRPFGKLRVTIVERGGF